METFGRKEGLPFLIMNMNDVKLIPLERQFIHAKSGQYITENKLLCRYYLIEMIEELISNIGDDPLREYYKDKYESVMDYLKKYQKMLFKVKMYYESMSSFDDLKKEVNLRKLYNQEIAKIPLFCPTLFTVFRLLIEKTEIRFIPCPNEFIKRMEKGIKVLGIKEKEESKQEEVL